MYSSRTEYVRTLQGTALHVQQIAEDSRALKIVKVRRVLSLTYKWAGDGVQIARFKAREAMGAHRHAVQAGVHYDVLNTFSSNAPMSDLRNLEVIAVEKELDH